MAKAGRSPTVVIENFGDTTLHIATFSELWNGDTWASSLPGVVGYWFQSTDDATTASQNAVDVALTASTGLFTFTCEEKEMEGKLYVMSQI